MDYYKKYLKYKTKFLNLKNLQYGGASSEVNPIKSIEDKYKFKFFQVKCFTTGFKQHEGECWNDSIMMFFCSQDKIKEVVQRKLRFLSPTEIIQLALLKNRQKLLPSLYLEKEYFDTILTNLPDYLITMKERFNYYYNYYNEDEEKQKLPQNFTGDASPRLGIECAKYGKKTILAESSNDKTNVSLLIILSSFLLDDIELIFNIKSINKIKREDSNNIIAVYNFSESYEGKHASLFYICNGFSYHFDDNEPQPKIFDFKSLLKSRIKSIENKTFDDDNVFTITYDNGLSLKTYGIILIKNNEYTPEDLKNKMNTLFYIEYMHNFESLVRTESRTEKTEKPFELFIDKYFKLGFDINSSLNELGDTLLHYCVPHPDFINLVRIKFLISKGIDVNLQNGDGDTILHIITKMLERKYEDCEAIETSMFYSTTVEMRESYSDFMKHTHKDLMKIKKLLQEILKLPNIRFDIKNNKGEYLVICPNPECYFVNDSTKKFCPHCSTSLK